MFRVFVIILPILLSLGVTYVSWKVALEGADPDRLKKLLVGALVLGILGGLLTWRQQNDMDDELNQMRKASAAATASQAAQTDDIKQFDQKIALLNSQVVSLQAQLAKSQNGGPIASAGSIKQQSAVLPKIYWTQADEAGGTTAVRFKIYGPLNIPAFVAICDRPCRATHGEIGSGSEGEQVVGTTGKVAGYVFSKPRPIQAGTEGFVIVEPGSAKVTEFRVLNDIEIPAFLK